MVRSQAPLPEGITRSISHGRYGEAADALRTLVRREPSVSVLVALADMTFQLGELTEARENALRAVEADPREHAARVLLARVRTALDERDAAPADFRSALELARSQTAPAGSGPIAFPAHQAQTSIAYAENRGLVFRGSIFHQTAPLRFAEGFENRRRNVTMLFRRTQS